MESLFSAPAFAAYAACRAAPGCMHDDRCTGASYAAVTPDDAANAYAARCEVRRRECALAGDSPCSAAGAAARRPEWFARLAACMERPCAEIRACIGAARPCACSGTCATP